MRAFISILLCLSLLLAFSSCVGSPGELQEKEFFGTDHSLSDNSADNADIVYVSRYGKIHKSSDCSGMKYYKVMDCNEAIALGFSLCRNCY